MERMGNRIGLAVAAVLVMGLSGAAPSWAEMKKPQGKALGLVNRPSVPRGASAIARSYNSKIQAARKSGDLKAVATLTAQRKTAISNFAHKHSKSK